VKLKGALASYYCACVKKGGVRVGFGGWWSPFAFCFSAFFVPFLQKKEFLFFFFLSPFLFFFFLSFSFSFTGEEEGEKEEKKKKGRERGFKEIFFLVGKVKERGKELKGAIFQPQSAPSLSLPKRNFFSQNFFTTKKNLFFFSKIATTTDLEGFQMIV